MTAFSASPLMHRSGSIAMVVMVCMIAGVVLGALYFLAAFSSPQFGELALPSMLAFVEAFSKGCLFLLLGVAGILAVRGRKNALLLTRFAASAAFLAFAGFAVLTALLSALFDTWTISYIARQGAAIVGTLLVLLGALVYMLKRPDVAHARE